MKQLVSIKKETLVIHLLMVFALSIMLSFTASAASHTWYQSGQGGGPSPGYLNQRDSHNNLIYMLDDAITSDIDLATSPGAYCNAYRTGTSLVHQNGNNMLAVTGFDPFDPNTPNVTRQNWQQGDDANNVCQAKGSTWGFRLSGSANNNCTGVYVPCGMHKFVRLDGGDNNRPWSDSLATGAKPALSFDMSVHLKTANVTGGAFGYFCPIIKDVTTTPSNYIEYCFMNWQKGNGFPNISQYDALAPYPYSCQSTNTSNIDIVFTTFHDNLNWSTIRPGSETIFGTSPKTAYQTASISTRNLQNVITRLKQRAPDGCGPVGGLEGRPHSTDVNDYALVGYEIGIEGGNISSLGSWVANENLRTTTDTLYPGDRLLSGQSISDSTGRYVLMMQTDGNLVITDSSNGTHPWHSNTYMIGAYAEMQTDGNLVIYRPYTRNNPIGSTQTSGNNGAYMLLQPDGNLVVYKGTQYKWASSYHLPSGF